MGKGEIISAEVSEKLHESNFIWKKAFKIRRTLSDMDKIRSEEGGSICDWPRKFI